VRGREKWAQRAGPSDSKCEEAKMSFAGWAEASAVRSESWAWLVRKG
jgi:hypothetical protein